MTTDADCAHPAQANGSTATTETNCHPFTFGVHVFQHNGVLAKFVEIKLPLLHLISVSARAAILGTTDSEHIAALYFTHLDADAAWTAGAFGRQYSLDEMKAAMRKTVLVLQGLVDEAGGDGTGHSAFNFCITDGTQMIATRMSHPVTREAPSLYYSTTAGSAMNSKYQSHPDSAAAAEQYSDRCVKQSQNFRETTLTRPGSSGSITGDTSSSPLSPAPTSLRSGRSSPRSLSCPSRRAWISSSSRSDADTVLYCYL